MISIRESIPNKIPGISSLFLTFNYNPAIVEVLHQFECKSYDKKTQTWELPTSYLEKLVEKLCLYDEIVIEPYSEPIYENNTYQLLNYKTKSFNHQLEAVQYGLNHKRWLLLDVPGLGKTKTIINLIEELKAKRNLKHVLVICGVNSLKSNWISEIHKHSELSCKILGTRTKKNGQTYIGSIKDRIQDFKDGIQEDIVVSNIETFRDDDIIKECKKCKFDMIVVDEVHTIKSPTSQQSKNLLKLDAEYKVGLTGTILLNSPLDLYVPLKFIGVEKSTFTNFKSYYCTFGGFYNSQIVGFKNTDILKDELESCSLRRTKDLLDLPPKNMIDEYVDLYDDQKKLYDNILKGVISDCDKADLSKMTILSSIGRLRQVTSYPGMLTSENIKSAKLDRAIDLANQIVSNGNKVVIFSTFKEPAKYLSTLIPDSILVTGDTGDIGYAINKFQNDPSCKVFIGTWQKCGTGITLTAASYMIFLDTPYTDGVFQQACDRIYRIGTKSAVFIYNLICKNTVDERVLKIVNNKKYLSDYVVDDIDNEDVISNLREYVEELKQGLF